MSLMLPPSSGSSATVGTYSINSAGPLGGAEKGIGGKVLVDKEGYKRRRLYEKFLKKQQQKKAKKAS